MSFSVPAGNITASGTVKGGNLSIGSNSLISTNTNGNISVTPNGTGTITLSAATGVTGTMIPTTQHYGVLRGRTIQSISHNVLTELTTFYTGGTGADINVVSGIISNPANGRLQVSVAGVYLATAGMELNTAASGTGTPAIGERTMFFRIDGGATYYGATRNVAVPTTSVFTCNICTLMVLSAGQYVSVWFVHAGGTTIGTVAGPSDFVNNFTLSRVL